MGIAFPPRVHRLYHAAIANEVSAHHEHALRNTLGAISSSIFFVKQRLEKEGLCTTDARVAQSLAVIDARMKEAVTIASRVTLPRPSMAPFVVAEVVEGLLTSLALPEDIRIACEASSHPPLRAVTGRDELELALCCLIDNATDAVLSKGGGTVAIGISDSEGGTVIDIRDDGVGFEAGVLEQAFHPFFTTRPDRLGMGLGVAKSLARELGGRVDLTEQLRGGARATLTLPRLPPASPGLAS